MSYILLDESGDLGFDFTKSKTSKNFIITILFLEDKLPLERIVKKAFSNFSKVELRQHRGTLHAYKEKPTTRLRLLNKVIKTNIKVMSVRLNKKKVYTNLVNEKTVLYNYVVNILLDRIYTKKLIDIKKPITLIASQRETNKFLNANFKEYIQSKIKNNHKLKLDMKIAKPHSEKSLQIADLICWSIFRSREYHDDSYKNIISNTIIEESDLFP